MIDKCTLSLGIGIITAVQNCCAGSALILSTGDGSDPLVKLVTLIMKEAYGSLNEKVEVQHYPGWKRSLIESNKGNTDGELFRIKGIDKNYPNLIRVPVPVTHIEGVAFTRKEKLKSVTISNWSSISQYTVSYVSGIKFIENGTKGFSNVEALSSLQQLLYVVGARRIDFGVHDRISLITRIKKYKYSDIVILEPPLEEVPLFHYLHKKNKHLVSKLKTTLQLMIDNNRIKEIRTGFFETLSN
ncbi:type 2 periplasmic-binding domain-containing protein [Spartinivicinus ruber]|uniref:transporter substrate-binding domain-containing protein n=1 Tax=Spartinivicinus ruber TaxID=2683272 RepID=UPI0013D12184|nr:transporter substrate-binding domain-containing protein [Spartinivicinus ruber]